MARRCTTRRCKRIQADYERTHAEISGEWDRVDEIGTEYQAKTPGEDRRPDAPGAGENPGPGERAGRRGNRPRREARLAEVREAFAAEQAEAMRKHEEEIAQWKQDEAGGWGKLAAEWQAAIDPIYAEIREIQADGDRRFPEWSEEWIAQLDARRWNIPRGAKFADLEVDRENPGRARCPGCPAGASRAGGVFAAAPLAFPHEGSLLVEAQGDRTCRRGAAECAGAAAAGGLASGKDRLHHH